MPDNLPERIEVIDAEIVDDAPPEKPVCWWRCGPCVRHPEKTAGEWGLQTCIDTMAGTLKIRDVESKYTVEIEKGWQVDYGGGDGLVSIDLLCFRPPQMPQAINWQRISRWGDTRHPGNNMDNWRFDFDGPEAFDV